MASYVGRGPTNSSTSLAIAPLRSEGELRSDGGLRSDGELRLGRLDFISKSVWRATSGEAQHNSSTSLAIAPLRSEGELRSNGELRSEGELRSDGGLRGDGELRLGRLDFISKSVWRAT